MLGWTHSGFSLDMSVRIPAASSRTREALAQYIARPPVSLSKMLVEEPLAGSSPQGCGRHEASVLYRSEYNPYFKTNARLFPALEFLVQLLQHLPDARAHLVRRYGLYSSRSRGTWMRKPWLLPLAPEGWLQQHHLQYAPAASAAPEDAPQLSVSSRESRSAPWSTAVSPETARDWARLLAKVL
jgi:hypothetical protein